MSRLLWARVVNFICCLAISSGPPSAAAEPVPTAVTQAEIQQNRQRSASHLAYRRQEFDLAVQAAADDRIDLLLVCNIDYTNSARARRFSMLTNTGIKVYKIASERLKVQSKARINLLKANEAAIAAVCQQLQKASVIHFATHGLFQPAGMKSSFSAGSRNVEFIRAESSGRWVDVGEELILPPRAMSGLALSQASFSEPLPGKPLVSWPGIFSAFELADLDLTQVDLAILSACETQLGEGVLGLQRALEIAGVRSVVASLWKVDDQVAADLMIEFYQRLWSPNERPGKLAALRKAQFAIRAQCREQHLRKPDPFYWAAFES